MVTSIPVVYIPASTFGDVILCRHIFEVIKADTIHGTCIFTHIYPLKSTIHVGKYTNRPMAQSSTSMEKH